MPLLPPVSVCMATYDGARHVGAQLRSILAELGPDDEVVVVDDASTDATLEVIAALSDDRVRVHRNPRNIGYVRTFERALTLARHDHLFLADQDDVWPPGRVAVLQRALGSASVVAGNVAVLDGPPRLRGPFGERDWRLRARTSKHRWRNLLRLAASDLPYYGSAMAVRRDALELALPFPPAVRELHDAWLALIGITGGTLAHVEDRVLLRRVHGGNATGRVRSLRHVVRGRIWFVAMCWSAWWRTHSLGSGP